VLGEMSEPVLGDVNVVGIDLLSKDLVETHQIGLHTPGAGIKKTVELS
jgi:hypothetical protein